MNNCNKTESTEKVNDDRVGFSQIDNRLELQNSVEINQDDETEDDSSHTDKVHKFFLELAGEDKEVDWKELKEILDYSLRAELTSELTRETIQNSQATPNGTTVPGHGDDNVFGTILGLLCGKFCKDTPLADLVPAPNESTTLLQSYRQEPAKKEFSKDVCRSMVAMLDDDHSGKLGFEEFKSLWLDIRMWKNAFRMYDKDGSGNLSGFELRQALLSAGYTLNNSILNILMHRYGTKQGVIEFDDFLACAVKLKTMIELFKGRDTSNEDSVSFTLDEWIEKTLYC